MKEKMKNTIRRVLSVFAAIAMIIGVMGANVTPVMAEDGYTITINNNEDGHTYKAYQIFTGDFANNVLSNINPGTNLDLDNNYSTGSAVAGKLATELKQAFPTTEGLKDLTDNATAAGIAEALEKANLSNVDDLNKLAQIIGNHIKGEAVATSTRSGTTGYSISGLHAGYYMIIDADGSQGSDKVNSAYTRIILQVTRDTPVTPKTDYPGVLKKVLQKNSSDNSGTPVWADTATFGSANGAYADLTKTNPSYTPGDKNTITFLLEGTLPTNFGLYDSYTHYSFVDTLSKGISPANDRFKAFLYYGSDIPTSTDSFTEQNGFTEITNLFDRNASTDNSTGATTIRFALKNGINLRDPLTTNNVTFTKDKDHDPKIIIFYQANLNADAVTTDDGNPNEVELEYTNNPNKNHTEDYGKTPKDIVKIFTSKLEPTKYKDLAQNDSDHLLSGATFTLYESKRDENSNIVADKTKAIATATSGTDGLLKFYPYKQDGTSSSDELFLANGTYVLSETTTPAGVNTMQDVVMTISATLNDGDAPSISSRQVEVSSGRTDATEFHFRFEQLNSGNGTYNTGIIIGNLINKSGSLLPSTGGIGTTIFYVIGGVIVAGAIVLLIARRRKNA